MLKLDKINKKIGVFSLRNIDLEISKGDYFVLIGRSGAGKSMILDIITGLVKPDSGRALLNGKDILKIPTQNRRIGIVYQKPTLFPHMTVFGNIAYPLRLRKNTKNEILWKVEEIADKLGISHLHERNIANLSGGEAQRVTIARTLVTKPEVLLLDEPLSHLDVNLRKELSDLLKEVNNQGQTIVHVTHNHETTLTITNRIAVIENGEIIQSGSVYDIFLNPKSSFVADFVGLKNKIKGQLVVDIHNSNRKIFKSNRFCIHINSIAEVSCDVDIIIPDEAIITQPTHTISNNLRIFNGKIKDIYQTKGGLELTIDIGVFLNKMITQHELIEMNYQINSNIVIHLDLDLIKLI